MRRVNWHCHIIYCCCVFIALPNTSNAQAFTFQTLAGSGNSGSRDGAGTEAGFGSPVGIAASGKGDLYVADSGDHTIRKITPEGLVSTFAGQSGVSGYQDGSAREARFSGPRGIAVDEVGTVYVTETYNHTIRKITPDGIVSTLAGSAGALGKEDGLAAQARLNQPWGIAINRGGDLYVADTGNHAVRKVTPEGLVSTVTPLTSNLSNKDGSTCDSRLGSPAGVVVDGVGNLFVLDWGQNTIRKITPEGDVSVFAGAPCQVGSRDGQATNALFFVPRALAADIDGNIYVADTGNQTIRKITSEGVVTTVAGEAHSMGSTNGPGRKARFSSPEGIAIDRRGIIYVADSGNSKIRKGVLQRLPLSQQP